MFNRGLRLFTIRGIPIEINISWIFVLALVTWSFATGYIPESYPGRFGPGVTWSLAFVTAILLFLSILFHELSHSLVAMANGLPIKRITLFMFGGVAQMSREVESASTELKMAAAGPLFTLVLAVCLRALAILAGRVDIVEAGLVMLSNINFGVFIFNMIPGFPLDGGRILRALIWSRSGNLLKATLIAGRIGQGFAWLLIATGVLGAFVNESLTGGLWLVFIGFFLRKAAIDGYRSVAYRDVLREIKIGDIMRKDVQAVSPDLDLKTLVEDFFLRLHHGACPVIEGEMLVGVIFLEDVTRIDRARWQGTTVREVMDRMAAVSAPFDFDSAGSLFPLMIQKGHSLVPVRTADGRLAGVVTRHDFSHAVKVMTKLLN
ncbi:MAG TPA: site-2 protease family protein [Candidatus Krumholzibacterium sp.]|nr:site-2 protease family protein [Candidatus Krumholzibacterium sp.]